MGPHLRTRAARADPRKQPPPARWGGSRPSGWLRRTSRRSPIPTPRTFFEVAAHPLVMTLSLGVFLRTPHATMPDLMLTPDETDDIISYILTLMLNALKGDQ